MSTESDITTAACSRCGRSWSVDDPGWWFDGQGSYCRGWLACMWRRFVP